MALSSLRAGIMMEIRTGRMGSAYQGTPPVATIKAMHAEGLELFDRNGNERGFVDPKSVHGRPVLEDLWVMQGSLCDLRCKHCYTASSPRNNRLEQIAFAELAPHLADAARFRVGKIYFTGGEVFVNEDVLRG